MRQISIVCLLLLALVLPCRGAQAAGHAHIVDDSEVIAPGTCQVESWVTVFFTGDGFADTAPACTFTKLPFLEVGVNYQHLYGEFVNAPLFGPALKLNLQPESTGLGLGIGFNAGVNLQTGDLSFASAIMLVTIPITDKVRLSLNAGWSYFAGVETPPHALFLGGQFEAQVTPELLLMVEGFGRVGGFNGAQMGLRFTPNDGPIDFDLLVGSFFDSASAKFITFGMTVRF